MRQFLAPIWALLSVANEKLVPRESVNWLRLWRAVRHLRPDLADVLGAAA